jgi:hypothetical protein
MTESTEPDFPTPTLLGKRRHWRLSDLIKYENHLSGQQSVELDPAVERWLTAAQVRERFQVSDMWLWRRTTGVARQAAKKPLKP